MSKGSDQNADLIDRLRTMQAELLLISSLTKDLSSILNKDQLMVYFQRTLKAELKYDSLSLITNHGDKNALYCSTGNSRVSGEGSHPYFQKCIRSAELQFFDLKEISVSGQDLFNTEKNSGMRTAVGFCLPSIEDNTHLLFLFYKNFLTADDFPERILKGIANQLSITIRNINFSEKFKNIQRPDFQEYDAEEVQTQNPDEGFFGIIGTSDVMQEVFSRISQVAPSQSTVIIYGETGTGKELIAQAVHQLSAFSEKKMIRINCAAIPSNLIESELFGHEKGSFTGATEERKGKFEQARNSTIFLDEIGELPIELQGRLLRVLQEREIERIGGDRPIKVNARVVAATNRNLEKDVAEEKFRSDLYYRLNVFPIELPPLRERKEDIPLLAACFLRKLHLKTGKKISGFSRKVLHSMLEHSWPGNIRELENTIERSMLTAKDKTIREMDFATLPGQPYDVQDFQIKTLHEFEKEYILKVLEKCSGKIFGAHGAAKLLGLPPTTLISKMQKLGIEKRHSFKDHQS